MNKRGKSMKRFGAQLICATAFAAAACEDPTAAEIGQRAYTVVATGGNHTCALAASEEMYCWGSNVRGQLGDGTFVNRLAPTPVSTALQFTSVTAGAAHSCAIASDARAFCWGDNGFSQLGFAGGDSAAPAEVTGGLHFIALSAGNRHTCGIATDSLAYCWGYNRYGQLGTGSNNSTTAPVRVLLNSKITSISAGENHTCAITLAKVTYCWGSNGYGQLGIGDDSPAANVPTPIKAALQFASVSAGATHTCGVGTDQRLWCWGSNAHGELGNGAAYNADLPGSNVPTLLFNGFRVGRAISAGPGYTCAIGGDNLGECWGLGDAGQLANGDFADHFVPQPIYLQPGSKHVGDLFKPTMISARGNTHACAIVNRAVFCWGSGPEGQLGVPGGSFAPLPQRVAD